MARPSSHSSVLVPAPAPAGPRVREFSRRAGDISITWDVRTIYDFVFSLSDDAGSTEDLPANDRAWLRQARAALTEELGAVVAESSTHFCLVLGNLAVDQPAVTDSRGLVELVRRVPQDQILRAVLSEDLRNPETRPLAERAVAGDADARRQLAEQIPASSDHKDEAYSSLLAEPGRAIDDANRVLGAWQPRFAEIEPRVGAIIRRDADARAADAARLAPADLIERTTGGIRWLSEPGVRRVILAPSYFARPYNYLFAGDDWRMFGYPVGDFALDPADPLAPPQTVVRLHRALGDETRLRILRLLRDRDLYLTEIAQALELSKPTIKHHLALLRAAGLVTLTEEGGLSYYSLRRQRLDDASAEIKRFLVD